jgi:hypothetical protein
MKFSAVVLFAAGALAAAPLGTGKKAWTTSTVYATTTKTITDCPETVTDCPKKGKVVTEIVAVSTTICPVEETHTWGKNTTSKYWPKPPVETETPCPESTSKSYPVPTSKAAPECPKVYVKTISTSVTTVVPTVIYSTVTEECAKPTYAPKPTGEGGCSGANCSSPAKPTKPVTAGAGSLVGSAVFAAAAGLAAYAFA